MQGKEKRGGERGGGRGEGREGICAKCRTCGKLCEPVENYSLRARCAHDPRDKIPVPVENPVENYVENYVENKKNHVQNVIFFDDVFFLQFYCAI